MKSLETERRSFYIVASMDADGNLAPALKPRRFTSYRQARFVAYTMATDHAPKQFVVLKAVFAAIPATVTGVTLEDDGE